MRNFRIVIFFLSFITLFACSKEDEILNQNNTVDKENFARGTDVIETYTTDLPYNITKIESVRATHPALQISDLIAENLTESNKNAIYYYNDGIAYLTYDANKVYAAVFNEKGNPIENLIADFSKAKSEHLITIDYLNSGNSQIIYKSNGSTGKESWGDCMDKAIDELYDDWQDEPLGTFSCWVTGPLCAIGGGIACGIKSL